MSYTYSCLFS